MKKRNATALSEILYQDINKIGDFNEDFQKLLFQNVLGLTSGVITGLNVSLDAPSGVSVAIGSMVDSSFAYGELEGVSGVSLETLPEDNSTRYDIVTAKYLELADSPGASYVLIDVESRTQSTQNVYRRKFGAVVIEIIEDTASGALTGGRIPLAQLEVTSGGIQDIVDLRQFTKPSNFDLDSMLDGLTDSVNELIGAYNPGGDVSGDIDDLTVVKIKNIPVSGAPTASGQILRINADQTAFEYVDGSDLGGGSIPSNQILQWTESGATISSGTYTYDIPAAASGSLTILPGDGMVFYDASEWSIASGQITFTEEGLPEVGSKLEFFYSSNTDIEDVSILSGYVTHNELQTELQSVTGSISNGISIAILQDQKAAGADPQTLTSGVYVTREITTEVFDPDNIVTLSSNQFTLSSGTYVIDWSAPAYGSSTWITHTSRIYNVTDSLIVGNSQNYYGHGDNTSYSQGSTIVTINEEKTFRIEHKATASGTVTGGKAAAFDEEVYTQVKITKIA